jgi:hypothetical protein
MFWGTTNKPIGSAACSRLWNEEVTICSWLGLAPSAYTAVHLQPVAIVYGAGLVQVSSEFNKGASDVGLWIGGCPLARNHQDDLGVGSAPFPKKMLGLMPCPDT